MAAIDIWAADIRRAMASKNHEAVCAIAENFFRRMGYENTPFETFDTDDVESLKKTSCGFCIKLAGDSFLHFSRSPERWCVSGSAEDFPQVWDSPIYTIERLRVPFAFLEGILFAMECYEAAAAKGCASLEADKKTAEAGRLRDIVIDRVCAYRGELRVLKEKIKSLQSSLSQPYTKEFMQQKSSVAVRNLTGRGQQFPDPPAKTISILAAKTVYSGVSGVYFVWRCGEIAYVGRANCIATRLASHHKAQAGDYISVVKMDAGVTWVAEPYYIWKYQPRLNGEVLAMENVSSGRPARPRKQKSMATGRDT
jgi:hypothetical protein